jgi:glyoxylase-like metal-dependent hydrolase (beta-lactamase superfamily II)
MKFGDFELSIVRECTMKLDGGAMFGVVPKTLWSKVSPADDLNRILITCNLLLIDTGSHKVLVETGMGDRWSDKERQRYELESLVRSAEMLAPIGIKNGEIDAVIISHLHFDHAGGATRYEGNKLVPTFPNAKYYVQKGEWEFAHKANARAKASYRPDDYEPLLAHEQIVFMDGDTEVVPGVWAKVTGGHTSHHQIVYFESRGTKGVFFADLMPTKSHVLPPWVMGYDHFPLHSCDEKSKWLARASAEKWLVVFDHELEVPWGHVFLNDSKKYEFVPLPQETLSAHARTEKVLSVCSSSAFTAPTSENCRKIVIETDSH